MTIFYIDTTSKYLYAGIVRNNLLIAEKKKCLAKDMSIYVVSEIDEMFQEANIEPKEIDKIIVVNGPGSFTGIRIGVTLAKIMAWGLSIPITTISSLEAMKESVERENSLIVPIIDARRNACYASIYSGNECVLDEEYLTLEKLFLFLKGLQKDYVFVSNDKFDFLTTRYNPDILKIVTKYKDRKEVPAHIVNPLYLKLTEAEENKMKEENE